MVGAGSEGTLKRLAFSCTFNVGESKCSVSVGIIPYSGANTLRCECQAPSDGPGAGYTFYGCDIPEGGHDFTKTIALVPNNLQCEPPPINNCPAGCVSINRNARQRRQLLFGSVGAECPEGCVAA